MAILPIKPRFEPDKLKIYRILNARMKLSDQEIKYYHNLEKRYEGEMMFDRLMENLIGERLIINDLLLMQNSTTFQSDSVIFSQDSIDLFEVKNYEGNFKYESGKFYMLSGNDIKNPLHQLERNETLLRQFLQSIGCYLPIEPHLIFMNPNFTLYQSPINKPIIYPTQLGLFMEKFNRKQSKLTIKHTKFADQVLSSHLNESPYKVLPNYRYDMLKKGPTCRRCDSFSISLIGNKFICSLCGFNDGIEQMVMRCVGEIKILFPQMNITANVIQDWCRVMECKRRISRILSRNLEVRGYGKWTYYELKI
ncbi:nuclease-related domain-containing protein [Bacillus salipaludis]|uniref:nuclease-related domain-containing protein n=1 Tax=Bacillus salipaludis TaxID=2547811 RepID=UPI002E1AED01|nr:nuclease-related domain-containing protein [Bacillus salipaludis]